MWPHSIALASLQTTVPALCNYHSIGKEQEPHHSASVHSNTNVFPKIKILANSPRKGEKKGKCSYLCDFSAGDLAPSSQSRPASAEYEN